MSKHYNKKSSSGWWIAGGIIVIVVVLFVVGNQNAAQSVKTVSDPSTLPGIQTSNAPWPAELDHLRERLVAIGLQPLSAEGTALHIHQHLDIFIDGKETPIPVGTGIAAAAGFISAIHVHDNAGIIHVESPTIQTFTLGQFFDIWGVRFTSQCIGGYCTQGDKNLKVFVNGTLNSGDPRQFALASHQEIVIAYGTDQELPNPIPSTYDFPPGD
jgi:hypothetical protein